MAGFCGLLLAAGISRAETVTNLEAVDANGVSTWNGTFPIVLTGVILNNPSEMLDSTPDFIPWDNGANADNLGASGKFSSKPSRRAIAAGWRCWMAQDYGNLPWEPHDGSDSYTDDQWTNRSGSCQS